MRYRIRTERRKRGKWTAKTFRWWMCSCLRVPSTKFRNKGIKEKVDRIAAYKKVSTVIKVRYHSRGSMLPYIDGL